MKTNLQTILENVKNNISQSSFDKIIKITSLLPLQIQESLTVRDLVEIGRGE